METHIKINIEIEQKKINNLSSLSIIQRHDWHHNFELRVSIDDLQDNGNDNLDSSKGFIGKPIKIVIGASSHNETYNQFNGIITEVNISRYSGSSSDIVIRGYSPTIMFDDGANSKSFTKMKLGDLVKKITNNYPKNELKVRIDAKVNPEFEYIAQYNESNYNFIGRLANTFGQWFYYNGKDLIFGKLENTNEFELYFGVDLVNFELGAKALPFKFKAVGFDYINHKELTSSVAAGSISGLDALGKHALNKSESLFNHEQVFHAREYFTDSSQLKDVAVARSAGIAGKFVVMTGNSISAKLGVGSKITVKSSGGGNSENYGTYTVISVSHFIDGMGVYQNKFEAIPSAVAIPPYNPNFHEPLAEIQQALVTNVDDPDKMGRVKVTLPWQKSGTPSTETSWIRVATPHAGKTRGIQFLPEVDDEVLVAFENNDINRPYVIGSLHHGKGKHDDRSDKENNIKTIRTRSGNEIKFTDESGEEEILIHNKSGENQIKLTMKDDGLILIQGKKKIQIKAEEIEMEAEKTITMKAKEIKTSATDKVLVESNQKLEIKGLDVKQEGTQKMAIAGGQMEIKAQATLDIDGGPKASLKSSGMLEVNGGANATIKAGIVMIN